MFLTKKKSKEVKGWLVYNGKPTRDRISREYKSSPTSHTESILINACIDTKEGRDMMTQDIQNAFIQAHVPEIPDGEQIVMKIWGILVDWFVELNRTVYLQYVV